MYISYSKLEQHGKNSIKRAKLAETFLVLLLYEEKSLKKAVDWRLEEYTE